MRLMLCRASLCRASLLVDGLISELEVANAHSTASKPKPKSNTLRLGRKVGRHVRPRGGRGVDPVDRAFS